MEAAAIEVGVGGIGARGRTPNVLETAPCQRLPAPSGALLRGCPMTALWMCRVRQVLEAVEEGDYGVAQPVLSKAFAKHLLL